MSVRILHCGQSIENYMRCIEYEVAGFKRRIAESGDLVYLAVRVGKQTLCGARGRLASLTDNKPWDDAEIYNQCFYLANLEFCQPFSLTILNQLDDKYWMTKYLQLPRPIHSQDAIELLNQTFLSRRQATHDDLRGPEEEGVKEDAKDLAPRGVPVTETAGESADNIRIMGTFQTIKFLNETDSARGLEPLVNANFYSLFPHFTEDSTVLLAENRLFRTASPINNSGDLVAEIGGIPDAILLVQSPKPSSPLEVNLIEYECFGESRVRVADKTNYLNGHIIPQLMRFAAAFSIVTDPRLRKTTIEKWSDRMAELIDKQDCLRAKAFKWLQVRNPGILERHLYHQLQKSLIEAFQSNVRVMLVVDELTGEQRDTIKNIINAFKLENEKPVGFVSYVVRLEQKLAITDQTAEYALSVQ